MVRRVVLALTLAVAVPSGAQVPVPDTGAVGQFMRRLGWVAMFGAWAQQRDVDPLTDSVKANLYVTMGQNPDLTGPDLRGGGFTEFGISCDDSPQRFLFVFSDSTRHFEKAQIWVRYRVDDRPAGEWAQWDGQASGSARTVPATAMRACDHTYRLSVSGA